MNIINEENIKTIEQRLLQNRRRKSKNKRNPEEHVETRTEIERDFDRILFCTPLRRLADKTQVFPLERNDSIRTRLTHSYEVSNLARSFGNALVYSRDFLQNPTDQLRRNIPALLAAIGLAHDLGNPPFGHQGEKAIQSWFQYRKKNLRIKKILISFMKIFYNLKEMHKHFA